MEQTPAARRIAIAGTNPVRLWGLTGEARIARMARAQGLEPVDAGADAALFADARFAVDPTWLRHVARTPGTALTLGGQTVLAHARTPEEARALAAGGALPPTMTVIAAETAGTIEDEVLRKRETPFVALLTRANVPMLERASYAGAYKGVTDLLTKYLWPGWAFWLTRIAARVGLTPNMVTTIGLIFCIAAGVAFYRGEYWLGLAAGLVSMVLDTVDGKLARCTITSSKWGNAYDHGIDLIHPPLWWWAWGMGLAAYGTPLPAGTIWTALAVILVAYVVQRLIEGAFIAAFGMHIHVWRKFDSDFRLITARRNPNWLILVAAMAVRRPDWGYLALAGWGAACCGVHLVRLGQAYVVRGRGTPIRSWLAEG